jgi:multidrug efflux pump subunit AcrA (membrane-fusion protein)
MRENSIVTAQTQLVRVSSGSISTTVKTTGKITPVQTTTLIFARQGTVTKLYRSVWENVQAGDIIAEVDASDAYMDVRSARVSLDNAKTNYSKLFTIATEADKIKAKNSLEESKNSLILLEAEYQDFLVTTKNNLTESETQIALLEEKMKLSESELEYTKQNLSTTNDASDLERDIRNTFLTVEDIARFLPTTLTSLRDALYLNNQSSDRYWDLGSKNQIQKIQTEKLFMTASWSYNSFEKDLSAVRTSSVRTLDDVTRLLTTTRTILDDLADVWAMTVELYDDTPTSSVWTSDAVTLAQDSLRTLSANISSKLSTTNNTYTTLKNYGGDAVQSLANKNTITQKEQSLQSAKNDLAKAKRNHEMLKTSQNTDKISRQNDIVRAKNSITSSEFSYRDMINGPDVNDLRSAKNNIASANINLEKSYLTLQDYQIIAPFDGVVNDIPWKIGDTTTANDGILVENKDAYEIALSLDQIDIVKVREGMNATITLDAFPTETYRGKVSRVSEVPTETSWVVSYEAVVELTIPRTDIYSKMSATVEVAVTEKNNILTIPTSAIMTENGKTYVEKAIDQDIMRTLGQSQVRSFSWTPLPPRDMSGSISGERRFGSGMMRNGSGESMVSSGGSVRSQRTRWSNVAWAGISTTEDVATEQVEIVTGVTDGQKTEVVSGLDLGEVVVIKVVTQARTNTNTSTNNTPRIPWVGVGGGRPPF